MQENDSDNGLASELLHIVKMQSRRWFIAFVIVLVMLFGTNLAWLYAWNLPDDVTSESYEITAEDEGNAIYNESGGVDIGTISSQQD